MAWVQNKIPERPITNFTTDWNDGITIGALVDNIAPGLCPDWPDWTPVRPKENATEAMDKAEQWLGVPQLIKPEELINPKKDELSMMTYLSQFPSAKLQPGAPLKPRLNPKKVRAYGPGKVYLDDKEDLYKKGLYLRIGIYRQLCGSSCTFYY